MRLAFNDALAHLLQQRLARHLPIQLAAQHLGVEEGSDQALAFRADPVGHRYADAQVALAAVAVQHRRQGRGHGHEQRQPAGLVEGMHPLGQGRVEVEAVQGPLMTLYGRAWAVGRQLEHRMLVAQARLPVRPLPRALAAFEPLALPDAVVQVLHRQGCQG